MSPEPLPDPTLARHGPSVTLRLHGYPSLSVDGRAIALSLKHGWALVACLAQPERRIGREAVVALLWPDADMPTGRARLRRLVHRLHALAGIDLVAGTADAVWLDTGGDRRVDIDVDRVRRAALAVLDGDAGGAADATALLASDSHAWLDGFSLGSDAFDSWLDARRQEQAQLLARALRRLASDAAAAGDDAGSLAAADRLRALDPFADAGHALAIAALGRLGEGAAVEAAYDACATLVRTEFGVRPSAAVEAAYAEALATLASRGAARPAAADAAPGIALPPIAERVRYARTDRGVVAWTSLGDGPETLLLVPEAWSHLETALDEQRFRAAVGRLAGRMRVLLLDQRGAGLSERHDVPTSPESAVEDVVAVLDAAGVARAWLLGVSTCGAIGIAVAARHPERVRGLLLAGVHACGQRGPGYPWAMDAGAMERWIALLRDGWGTPVGLDAFAPGVADDPQVRQWWVRTFRQASTPLGIGHLLRSMAAIDVRDRLAGLRVPTLVLQRRGDRIVRSGAARYLADRVPGAELVWLEGDDHYWWHGDAGAALEAIESFVDRHPAGPTAAAPSPPASAPAGTVEPAEESPIRYARSVDGVRLAWTVSGAGPPVVKAATWLSHLDVDRTSPVWSHLVRALSREHRFLRYDERGCGLSDRDVDDLSFGSWLRDLETVVEAAGLDRFALLGISQGASIAIAYAAAHPERVTRLVLHGGYARGRLVRSATPEARAEAETMAQLAELGWGSADPAFRQYFTSQFIPGGSEAEHRWFNELERISTSPATAGRFLRVFAGIDVAHLLERVACPTLVLHSERDLRVGIAEGRFIAERIPGARFVAIDSGNHLLLENEPGWAVWRREAVAFLAGD